jgi:hypothetical protein
MRAKVTRNRCFEINENAFLSMKSVGLFLQGSTCIFRRNSLEYVIHSFGSSSNVGHIFTNLKYYV